MEFQRRGASRGFGTEETYVLNLAGMVQLELMKGVKKGIPGSGSRKNGKNVPRRGSEKSLCLCGITQFDMKTCSGKQTWKCRSGPALEKLKMPGYGIGIL